MHNLFRMSTSSYIEGFHHKPRIDLDLLSTHSKGLIATSGCVSGEIQTKIRIGDYEGAKSRGGTMRDILGKENFFIEIMDHGLSIERRGIKDLLRLAKNSTFPLS